MNNPTLSTHLTPFHQPQLGVFKAPATSSIADFTQEQRDAYQ
jgi:hypothetical protein